MKLGIVGDVHFSKNSSIIREQKDKFSARLENCIASINWAEDKLKDCDKIIYLGDFFDTANLNSMELTAFSELKWNNKPHIMIVGNHEMGVVDLSLSSAHIFNLIPNFTVVDKPTTIDGMLFLPYILENQRKPFKEYINDEKIVFSHNDIAGIQMGLIETKSGFNKEEITKNCKLFINGHFHNGSKINNAIINVGNFTGQNFNEDAEKYSHNVMILDTNNYTYELIENPFAFNFYKIEDLNNKFNYNKLKNNAVITVKTSFNNIDKVKDKIQENKNIVQSRVLIDTLHNKKDNKKDNSKTLEDLTINHLEKFQEFILKELGTDKIIKDEIQNIIR